MNTSFNGLTEDQQQALDALDKWLHGDEPTMKLTAYAGCGKTFLVSYWLNQLSLKYNRNRYDFVKAIVGPGNPNMEAIYVTAPTHKAVNVLRGKVDSDNDGMVKLMTTHSALSLKPQIVDRNTGRQEFKPERDYDRRPGAALIIVDEASMIGQSLFDYLRQEQLLGTKILYIGDVGQIPPVGEPISPVFRTVRNGIELTSIVRQAEGNPIISLAHTVRQHQGSIRALASEYGMVDSMYNALEHVASLYADKPADTKVIAWRNATVAAHNKAIRTLIYGHAKERYMQGELITFLSPYQPPLSMKVLHQGKELVLDPVESNTDCRVIRVASTSVEVQEVWAEDADNVTPENLTGKYYIHVPAVLMYLERLDTGQTIKVVTYDRDDDEVYMNCMGSLLDEAKQLRDSSKWQEYYNFMSRFADIEYGYCITAHRSQGSTYTTVVVDDKDINANHNKGEKTKLYYTAVTRSADTLIVV